MGDFYSANITDRDDELRRLVIEMDQLEKRRSAIQDRIKLLLGLIPVRRVRSRFTQADLDALARSGQ